MTAQAALVFPTDQAYASPTDKVDGLQMLGAFSDFLGEQSPLAAILPMITVFSRLFDEMPVGSAENCISDMTTTMGYILQAMAAVAKMDLKALGQAIGNAVKELLKATKDCLPKSVTRQWKEAFYYLYEDDQDDEDLDPEAVAEFVMNLLPYLLF